jgi:hypothetical protein
MTVETKADLKAAVLSQLGTGHAAAVSGVALAKRFGLKDDRPVRTAIRQIVREGIPVMAALTRPFGYYIADDAAEAISFAAKLRSYCVESAVHRRDFLRAARRVISPEQAEFKPRQGGVQTVKKCPRCLNGQMFLYKFSVWDEGEWHCLQCGCRVGAEEMKTLEAKRAPGGKGK